MSMSNTHLPHPYRALVIGASGAIGAAFVAAFEADPACAYVAAVSRSGTAQNRQIAAFDLSNAESIAQHAQQSAAAGPYHLIVDATGALHIDGIGPEKSLDRLQSAHLARAFEINTIGPALVLRHFSSLLATGPAVYAKLSARVGSISDNKKGGWYGYRASKAAMNMILQPAALELQRKNPALRVVALQPGTVRSTLSAPFSTHVEQLLEPEQSVSGMLAALKNLQTVNGAHFIDYRGDSIDW